MLFCTSCLFFQTLSAQLIASFTINKESGCRPLTVQFTNTTTGAGANVTYTWNFGNGNTSALTNPGATYIEERTYTVTLTATSGGNTSTATKQITVYKTPTVDFSATPTKGCMPLEVGFTANATAGDGTIAKYFWDFGDGDTEEGPALTAPKHTYTFSQQAPVSLTVTNSFGCFNTRTYGGLVDVYQSVKADFTFNPVRTCTPTDPVKFDNKSQAPNGTTWLWDFGDGKTSTEKSPTHVYDKEGDYNISLKATSSNGCIDAYQHPDVLKVAYTKADFYLPEKACLGERVKAINLSETPFIEAKWWANDEIITNPLFYQDTIILFTVAGTYNVKLEINYGDCKVQKNQEIIIHPRLSIANPISKRTNEGCGPPASFEVTDNTEGAVGWIWYDIYRKDTLSKQKSFNHTFNDGEGSSIQRWVINEFGCKTEGLPLGLFFPITTVSVHMRERYLSGCAKDSFTFFANPVPNIDSIVSFKWDFGDGKGKSTLKSPKYAFEKAGNYKVVLEYETTAGCKGTAEIVPQIEEIPEIDFYAPGGTTICGSTPVNIIPRNYVHGFYDYYVDGKLYHTSPFSGSTNLIFNKEGTYDVVLYYSNDHCFDTIIKKDYLTVLPPFPKIHEVINTCEGDRSLVTFIDSSRKVEKWKWDFGDGTTREYYQAKDTIQHHYAKTGSYPVVLETSYGPCTLIENNWASVLLKQDPKLSSPLPIACADKNTTTLIGPLETNPHAWTNFGSYSIWEIQFKDSINNNFENEFLYGLTPINGYQEYRNLFVSKGKFEFRYILKSWFFHCFDTTNYLNIELKGPSPNLEIYPDSLCVRENLTIIDRSTPYSGTELKSWQWIVGDYTQSYFDTTQFTTGNLNYSLRNANSGNLNIDVFVTDSEGCVTLESKTITVSGPKSSFDVSSSIVALNSTVTFTNTTDYYRDYNVTIKWILPDNTESSSENESFTFTEEGFFTVKLININDETGCSDTAYSIIEVRKVNAQFTHSISYVNNNGCPPAIVRFTSTATNAVRYGWNFGNGATGGNSTTVTHTYNQPGIFQVWHYSYDENNNVDSSFDFIEIKGPYAIITANRLSACNNLQVTLSADVKNADSFTWDLGDGTINSNPQTQITHQYLTAGVYTPSLILEDEEGCAATSILPNPIIVDSLGGSFSYSPDKICAGTHVNFTANPQSFSATQLGKSLTYEWKVNDGNNNVPGNENKFTHAFNSQGTYAVTLTLGSEYGCTKVITNTVNIQPPLNAAISAINQICQGDTASFRATASGAGIQFRWYIPGQPVLTTATTNAFTWNAPGTYNISLTADNGACIDSVVHILAVNPTPAIVFTPGSPRICLGDTLAITVTGNDNYTWDSHAALLPNGNNGALVYPAANTWFAVTARSNAGCTSRDSLRVTVTQPFTLLAKENYEACLGETVNLSATGADRYQWIPAAGLSNATIANPVANINSSAQYRVLGFDAFDCFTDTVQVQVTINALPQVNAGPDVSMLSGESIQLNARATLQNVTWNWTPATYLNCTNCANPVSKPNSDITYTVTATTDKGCSASDDVSIKLLCAEDRIFIPTGFTPDRNGLNERFGILGTGFSLIKSFRIFDRWGQVAFERSGTLPTDPQSFWNGNYPGGKPAPSGIYQYIAEVACATGAVFSFKGSVTLVR